MGTDISTGEPAPMVNGMLMKRYVGKKVRCVVKVVERGDLEIVAQTSDGQMIRVIPLSKGAYLSPFVEVIGVVDGSGAAIREQVAVDFGTNFDLAAYDRLCLLANNEARSLFM